MTAREPSFKDHFSGHAASYAAFRPRYPDALFDFLARSAPAREHAWDCGTGNGQTAVSLAAHFERVTATDASAAQIAAAEPHPRVAYRVAAAEASGIDEETVDLVTVAQALHWFDIERFFAEALRVLAPGGVLAVWCYGLCRVERRIDAVIEGLYRAVDAWWPPERRLIEEGYRSITLPLPALPAPAFAMSADWSADAMLGYLRTWSACQRHLAERGTDPVRTVEDELCALWGAGSRTVRWPLALKAGRRPA
ncbi:MAG TPA: class I SAM-dependent methyltransferase [Woeseiaceae bacterium]